MASHARDVDACVSHTLGQGGNAVKRRLTGPDEVVTAAIGPQQNETVDMVHQAPQVPLDR